MQPAILADISHFCSLYEAWSSELLGISESISGLLDLDSFTDSNPFLFSLSLVNQRLLYLLKSFVIEPAFKWDFLNSFHENLSLILSSFEEIFFGIYQSDTFRFKDFHSLFLKLLDKFQSSLFAFPFLDCSM